MMDEQDKGSNVPTGAEGSKSVDNQPNETDKSQELKESQQKSQNDNKYEPDKVGRIIMLVYGVKQDDETQKNESPFWVYTAVKPSMYEKFKQDEKAGALDLHNFEPYGEVIVSGDGEVPPEEVTLKVAEAYGADPSQFFKPIDPMAEIDKKITELKSNEDGDAEKPVGGNS